MRIEDSCRSSFGKDRSGLKSRTGVLTRCLPAESIKGTRFRSGHRGTFCILAADEVSLNGRESRRGGEHAPSVLQKQGIWGMRTKPTEDTRE